MSYCDDNFYDGKKNTNISKKQMKDKVIVIEGDKLAVSLVRSFSFVGIMIIFVYTYLVHYIMKQNVTNDF